MFALLAFAFAVLCLIDCQKNDHIDTSPLIIKKFYRHTKVNRIKKNEKNPVLPIPADSGSYRSNGDIISLIKKVDQRVTDLNVVVQNNQKKTLEMLKQLTAEFHQYRHVVYYPPGTQDYSASRHYQGAAFFGYGHDGGCDDFQVTDNIPSPEKCIELCKKKREKDGSAWNGINWYYREDYRERCVCTKNERGHTEETQRMHYKFE